MIPRFWLKPAQLAAFHTAQTDAHRLCSHPDGWVEKLGEDVLICYKHEAVRDAFLGELEEWSAETKWVPARVFAKFLPRFNDERIAPVLLQGDATLPMVTTVRENGVRYGLDFEAGYSHGLFLDQRGNRAFLRRIAPKRLLNTFAYTCSFSVIAALGGGETVSVDLSKKSIDRGRQNFGLNDLSTEQGHRFLADDVLDVLPRLARRGEMFDAIILDPPTFSRGNQGRRWQIEQNFEELLNAAIEMAAPGARILISTNCAKLDPPALERMARFSLKMTRRNGTMHREPALPDFPPAQGSSTLWLTVR
jgi:23S rRNA (cytosine1962-C5)-methyltransferase